MDKETQAIYGKTKIGIRKHLRQEALRQMHFSTMEEFFMDITSQYAKVIYSSLFFDFEGKQILAGDTEKIEERKALQGLFPGLNIKYPEEEGKLPELTAEKIAQHLMREP